VLGVPLRNAKASKAGLTSSDSITGKPTKRSGNCRGEMQSAIAWDNHTRRSNCQSCILVGQQWCLGSMVRRTIDWKCQKQRDRRNQVFFQPNHLSDIAFTRRWARFPVANIFRRFTRRRCTPESTGDGTCLSAYSRKSVYRCQPRMLGSCCRDGKCCLAQKRRALVKSRKRPRLD
jgi:hypothetical protein